VAELGVGLPPAFFDTVPWCTPMAAEVLNFHQAASRDQAEALLARDSRAIPPQAAAILSRMDLSQMGQRS
jgi:hypothetical protein